MTHHLLCFFYALPVWLLSMVALWIESAHGSFDCRIVSPFLPQAVTSTWTVGASAPISSPPVISAEGGALSFLLPVVESLHWARWRQERLEKIRWFGFQPNLPVPLSRKRVGGWLCVHNTSLFLAIHPLLSSHRTWRAGVMARKTGACTASREWLIAEQSRVGSSRAKWMLLTLFAALGCLPWDPRGRSATNGTRRSTSTPQMQPMSFCLLSTRQPDKTLECTLFYPKGRL